MGIFHPVSAVPHPALGNYVTSRGEDAFSMASRHPHASLATNDVPRVLTAKTPGSLILGRVREEGGVVARNNTRVVIRIDRLGQSARDPTQRSGKLAAVDTRYGL